MASDASINAAQRPESKVVTEFHSNADTDNSKDSIHHTLGFGQNQAAPGSHMHDGTDSYQLLADVELTGSRGSGAALASVLVALVQLGAIDKTEA